MRIKAYILAADPAFIEASVMSYYDLVEEIVVSYDENSRAWTGVPVPVEECLERLKAIDRAGKMRYCPGHYARLDHDPMENDTYQRQCALDEASKGADWVLQVDTDEVLADPAEFRDCLNAADRKGFQGLDYPMRVLRQQIGKDFYLESCTRFWGIAASYSGPVAVKPGARLRHARQCDIKLFRVDFKPNNTDPAHPKDTPVHRVIRPNQGIYHYSWARDEQSLRRKLNSWGHAKHSDWNPEFERWMWYGRHPYLAMFLSTLERGPKKKHLRIVRIKPDRTLISNQKER
jgi:glycosyltransferase involved in cell wall biosynthesis